MAVNRECCFTELYKIMGDENYFRRFQGGDCPNRPARLDPPMPLLQHKCILLQRWLHKKCFIICWTDGVVCHSDGQGGEKNKGGIRGAKQHKGGENVRSLS